MTDLERALVHLQSAYRVELDALQTEAYKRGLMDLRGEIVREAVARTVQSEKFFPAIATIREYATEVAKEGRREREQRLLDAPIWDMSDENHAELMRQIRAVKEKVFAKSMDKPSRADEREQVQS